MAGLRDGSFLSFPNVHPAGDEKVTMTLAAASESGCKVMVMDSCDENGRLLGTCSITASTGHGDAPTECELAPLPSTVDLCLVFTGGDAQLDRFSLT